MDLPAVPPLALIGPLAGSELLLIAAVAVMIFGSRLPEVAMRAAAHFMRARRVVTRMWREAGLEQELRRVQWEIERKMPRDTDVDLREPMAKRLGTARTVPAAPADSGHDSNQTVGAEDASGGHREETGPPEEGRRSATATEQSASAWCEDRERDGDADPDAARLDGPNAARAVGPPHVTLGAPAGTVAVSGRGAGRESAARAPGDSALGHGGHSGNEGHTGQDSRGPDPAPRTPDLPPRDGGV